MDLPLGGGRMAGMAALVSLALAQACRPAGPPGQAAGGSGPRVLISNIGSDTMLQLAQAWAETYGSRERGSAVSVTGGGTGTGISALINGTADIANASRAIKDEEVARLAEPPTEHVVAIDALAIIVNLANPISRITLAELAALYTGKITNWRDLGGHDEPVVLLSRETNSGTHVYFLEEVIRGGDKESDLIFAPQTLLMPSSVGITLEVRRNPNAIGYDGLGYVSEHEKVLEVAVDAGGPYVLPSIATASDRSYPLSRDLYMITPGSTSPAVEDYLRWILGPEGQAIVAGLGYVPVRP